MTIEGRGGRGRYSPYAPRRAPPHPAEVCRASSTAALLKPCWPLRHRALDLGAATSREGEKRPSAVKGGSSGRRRGRGEDSRGGGRS